MHQFNRTRVLFFLQQKCRKRDIHFPQTIAQYINLFFVCFFLSFFCMWIWWNFLFYFWNIINYFLQTRQCVECYMEGWSSMTLLMINIFLSAYTLFLIFHRPSTSSSMSCWSLSLWRSSSFTTSIIILISLHKIRGAIWLLLS